VAHRLVLRRWVCPPGGTTRAWDVRRSIDGPCPQVAAAGISGSSIDQCGLEDDGRPEPPVSPRPDKPAYRVPTMDEVRAVPWNGLTVISTFAGAGGSSTGYRMAGYRVLAAVEFVPAAGDSYEANMGPHTTLLRRDIRTVGADELLAAAGVAAGELDVLDGSPPCEPFSSAGRRERTWNSVREYSGQRQRTDDLFFEYARLVDGIRPRVFVAENVTGLTRGRARGYFKRILAALRDCGYRVQARVLDAAWLGVPQHRERVIFVGVRDDLDSDPAFPAPLRYQYSVRDAIGDLLAGGGDNARQLYPGHEFREASKTVDAPAMTVCASGSAGKQADLVEGVEQTKGGHGFRPEEAKPLDRPAWTVETKSRDPDLAFVEHVKGSPTHGHGEVARSIDEPAFTVQASDASKRGQSDADLRFVRDTGKGANYDRADRADQPSPTIVNGHGNSGHYQVEETRVGVRHDTGGRRAAGRARRDRIDEPSPAIAAGQGNDGTPSGHYTVEELRLTQPARPDRPGNSFGKGRRVDLAQDPAPTLAVGGFGGIGGETGYNVEYDQQTVGNDAFEPRFGSLDEAHPTVTAEGARTSGELRSSVTRVRRRFTIAELRRICGFPDDFVLAGTFSQQWERLGDAVPPPMARAWAEAIADGPLASRRRA
jgi:DNA-cytosine methyltransferase